MIGKPFIIESFSRVAPIGLCFWDEVSRSTIVDGLLVTAYQPKRPDRRFALTLNRSSTTFVLQNILGSIEFGAGDQNYWDVLPALKTWVIEVNDTTGRFLPLTFLADLPHRDLFAWACGSPIDAPCVVPLFSSPTRSVSGSFGVIRADLRVATGFDPLIGQYPPAPWSIIEAWYKSKRIGLGIADDQGRILVVFPYPEPINPPIQSPPGARIRLSAQSWPIDLRAFYSPGLLPLVPGQRLPDLCSTMTQSPVTLVSQLSPLVPFVQVEVKYGLDAVLKTTGHSELLINP